MGAGALSAGRSPENLGLRGHQVTLAAVLTPTDSKEVGNSRGPLPGGAVCMAPPLQLSTLHHSLCGPCPPGHLSSPFRPLPGLPLGPVLGSCSPSAQSPCPVTHPEVLRACRAGLARPRAAEQCQWAESKPPWAVHVDGPVVTQGLEQGLRGGGQGAADRLQTLGCAGWLGTPQGQGRWGTVRRSSPMEADGGQGQAWGAV